MEKLLQYKDVENYILGIPKFTKKNTPQDTRRFYEFLGRPGEQQKIIHVAGTNGKGSVCSYLCTLLMECGYRTGMFTSPHLERMTERVRVQGKEAAEEKMAAAFTKIMGKVKEIDGYHPTFFEILFFMAMLIFEEEKTDYIILETGLGGRLDATNCITAPVMTIITRIGLDHIEYLGDTLEKIAWEKAGILKPEVPLVCLQQPSVAYRVISEQAELKKVPVFAVNQEEKIKYDFRKKAIDFSYKSRYYDYIRLTLATGALYQTENAVLALSAFELLEHDRPFTAENLKNGLLKMVWAGRMEEVLPEVYVDGAHNGDGIRAFLESVALDGKRTEQRRLLFTVVKDKDYKNMIKALAQSGLFGSIAVAGLQDQRGVGEEELYHRMEEYTAVPCQHFDSVEKAFGVLLDQKGEEDRIYAAGSLYLVGQIKTLLRRNLNDQF